MKLFIKVFAPNLKLANLEDSVFPKAGNLKIITTPTFTNAIIGEENGSKKHTLIDYDDVSWFYAHTTGFTKETKLHVGVYQKDKDGKPVLKLNLSHTLDEDGVLKSKIQ